MQRNDHLAFEDKPARVLSFIWLLSLSFLVFLEFVGSLALLYFVVFQHFESMLRSENLMESNPENEQAVQQHLHDQSICLQSVDLNIARPLG